jgi:hypothetical protein
MQEIMISGDAEGDVRVPSGSRLVVEAGATVTGDIRST